MGKIVHVELKLYAEDNPDLEKEIMKELSRIFQKSPNLLISSIKSINIIKEIDVNFKESKFIQDKVIEIHQEIIGNTKINWKEYRKNNVIQLRNHFKDGSINQIYFSCSLCEANEQFENEEEIKKHWEQNHSPN